MQRSPEQISYNMSRIKSRDTSIELLFRSGLRKHKIRFRGNAVRLVGKPDFVILDKRTAVFCDSAFWHGYKFGKTNRHNFKANKSFWMNKIKKNIVRDRLVNKELKANGWRVLRFWDFQIKKNLEACLRRIKTETA